MPADHDRLPRVLLVDPDEQLRVLLGQLFVDAGYRVVTAANYAQAIVSSRRDDPAVIVTELRNGQILSPEQYILALRRHSPAPIILHTDLDPGAAELRAWGVWAVVVKGRRPTRLLDMVAGACEATRVAR
jgi:DNA-binding NtrC family response regulator